MLRCRDAGAHPLYEKYYTRLYLRVSDEQFTARVRCFKSYRAVKELVHRLKSGALWGTFRIEPCKSGSHGA
jgi:hypothetical protein